MLLCKDQCDLPTISMIGGGAKNLYFHIYDKKSGDEALVSGCQGRFSIVNGASRHGFDKSTTVLVKEITPFPEDKNVMQVTLDPQDTLYLNGKYIYQVWIIGADGVAEEPQQGEFYVKRNIDPDYQK